jgi:hypothetical protein
MKSLLVLLSFVCPLFVGAGIFNPDSEVSSGEQKPWSDKPFLNDDKQFQFVVVTDRTGGQRDGIFEQAVQKINLMRPEFVMSVGDLVEGYLDNEAQNQREWDYFNGMVNDLDMRFFYLPGNHDIWSDFSRQAWEKRFGTSYYHFVYQDVLFLAINSEDGRSTTMGQEQVDYFLKVLEEHQEVSWTMVFTHKPLWYYEDVSDRSTGWKPIEEALKKRQHTVFAGHRHRYLSFPRNNTRYIQLATTGGGSDLSGPIHGRFDHFVWVTMTEDGPTIANILLDGVLDQDVRSEANAEIVDHLGRQFSVSIDPVHLGSGDQGLSYQTTVEITNNAEIPMTIDGRFGVSADFTTSVPGVSEQVEAHGTIRVPVVLNRLPETHAAGGVIPFDYSIVYRPDSLGGPVLWERTAFAAIEPARFISTTDSAITLDGKPTEWATFEQFVTEPLAISGARTSWQGPDDLSYEFALRQDAEQLYIGLQVVDDTFIDKGAIKTGSQDHFVLTIDARPRTQWAQARSGDAWNEAPLTVRGHPSVELDHSSVSHPEEIQVTGKGLPTDSGYFFELAIPHSVLNKCAGQEWKDLRINLTVTDVDSPIGSRTGISWRPAWNAAASYPDSGRFRRFE